LSYEKKKKKEGEPQLKYFKVWECLMKVNIPLNENRKKFLWLNLFVIPSVLFSHLMIILFVFLLVTTFNMCNFLRLLNDILMQIEFSFWWHYVEVQCHKNLQNKNIVSWYTMEVKIVVIIPVLLTQILIIYMIYHY